MMDPPAQHTMEENDFEHGHAASQGTCTHNWPELNDAQDAAADVNRFAGSISQPFCMTL
jgi:predicted lipoprotein with Yx(FWY)xxD motif